MSRIGAKIISIPSSVTVTMTDNVLRAEGTKGANTVTLHPKADVKIEGDTLQVNRHGNDRLARSIHGLTRMLVANAVSGVTDGFTKRLEMVGTGYRAQTDGQTLTLSVGFSHPVEMKAPEGITFAVEKNTLISITGIDKQKVGQTAANIRDIRKPEPYKGKGIRYEGEIIRRKAGKAAKAGK